MVGFEKYIFTLQFRFLYLLNKINFFIDIRSWGEQYHSKEELIIPDLINPSSQYLY